MNDVTEIKPYLNKLPKAFNSLVPNRKNNEHKIVSSYLSNKKIKSSVRFELPFENDNKEEKENSIRID